MNEEDSTVCRFLSFKGVTGEQFLDESKLLVAAVSHFNDPLDCCPKYDGLARQRLEAFHNPPGRAPIPEDPSVTARVMDKTRFDYPMGWRREFSKEFGVVCFSETHRNNLMWSHYSDSHRGFAIEFDRRADFLKALFLKVEYSDKRPCVVSSPDEQILATKSAEWRYEREWRLVMPLRALPWDTKTKRHYIPVAMSTVRKVFVGWMVASSDLQRVLSLRMNHPHIEVRRMVPFLDSFEMEDLSWDDPALPPLA
ncbi:MAG TPA: DUF2971 domain-containing protein [Candidatus Limnocylindria bacterium]|nr:DUF2971 domain-containing protein [Candidatus Limnocylindria bacterium]